jgi:hypothetical protein
MVLVKGKEIIYDEYRKAVFKSMTKHRKNLSNDKDDKKSNRMPEDIMS